jgi:hypothetical protein
VYKLWIIFRLSYSSMFSITTRWWGRLLYWFPARSICRFKRSRPRWRSKRTRFPFLCYFISILLIELEELSTSMSAAGAGILWPRKVDERREGYGLLVRSFLPTPGSQDLCPSFHLTEARRLCVACLTLLLIFLLFFRSLLRYIS